MLKISCLQLQAINNGISRLYRFLYIYHILLRCNFHSLLHSQNFLIVCQGYKFSNEQLFFSAFSFFFIQFSISFINKLFLFCVDGKILRFIFFHLKAERNFQIKVYSKRSSLNLLLAFDRKTISIVSSIFQIFLLPCHTDLISNSL